MGTTTSTRTDYAVTLSPEATDAITAMQGRVSDIGRHWGETSPEYAKAAASLAQVLATIFGRPITNEARITRDGPLSLLVINGFTVGVIWHETRRHCTTEGCGAYLNDDGSAWTYSREHAPILDHEHTPSYPLWAVAPGSWSLHS